MVQPGTAGRAGTRRSGPVVGREYECQQLDEALGWLGRGSPGVSLIELTGDPGIGKTRLLAELMTRAEQRGFTVCTGQASWTTRHTPHAPFLDALDGYLDDSADVYQAVGGALERLAVPALVVVLDDLHWADPVEMHLSHIFAKLNASSRARVAAAVASASRS